MKILTKIITVISVCFVIATISISYQMFNSTSEIDYPYLEFNMNEYEKTLTVSKIDNFDYNWEDITLYSGLANLPSSGKISVNDVITNCYGTIKFKLPNDSVFGGWPFNEKPEELIEDIRFIGEWEGTSNALSFYPNGTYFNSYHSIDSDDNDSEEDVSIVQMGDYSTKKCQLILDESYYDLEILLSCDVSFSKGDTQLDITCFAMDFNWSLQRSFDDDLFLTILNASDKLDDCLTTFIDNYSNSSYKENLSNGLNVIVELSDYLTQDEIDNLSTLGIYFNTDNDGNVINTNYNYSIKIDSLQDLYYLVSRSEVKKIKAVDTKFLNLGCTNII